jgi:signal transduction histidine kinase
VRLDVDPVVESSRFPEQLELTAYLVVLEGLANSAKHAPEAPVSVRLGGDTATLLVTVHDDGPGFAEPPAGGSGLGGLRDRLAATGGSLDVRSRPGAGTTLIARLPITAPVADA